MKKLVYILSAVFTAALLSVSCVDTTPDEEEPGVNPDAPTPHFPSLVEVNLEAGESYTVSIEPNVDWSIELKYAKESTGWFWILDGNSPVYSLKGKAGEKVDVVVVTSEQVDFDIVHSCTLDMTMGDSTATIARFTRGTIERSFSISYCLVEEGDYQYSEEAGDIMYVYGDPVAEGENIPMMWNERTGDYRRSLLITADFEWQLKSLPSWCENLKIAQGAAGDVIEVEIEGNPLEYPLEDDSEPIVFCAADNQDVEYLYNVQIPGCGDIFEIKGFQAETEANKEGEMFHEVMGEGTWSPAETGLTGSVLGIEGASVAIFVKEGEEWNGGINDDSWIIVTLEEWEASGAVLQERDLNIKLTVNESDASREAIVLVLHAGQAYPETVILDASTFIENGHVKEEYKHLLVTHVTQLAVSKGLVSPLSPGNFPEDGAELVEIEDGTLNETFGTKEAYRLSYDNQYASVSGNSNLDASFEIVSWAAYNADNTECGWISVVEVESELSENSFRVVMDHTMLEDVYAENIGYLVLDNANGPAVVLECVYQEKSSETGSAVSMVAPVAGVTLVQVTSENVAELTEKYKDIQNYNDPSSKGFTLNEDLINHEYVYILTYTSAPSEVELIVPEYLVVWLQSCDSWVEYGESTVGDEYRLSLNLSDPGKDNVYGMIQLWKDWSSNYKAQIYCVPEL